MSPIEERLHGAAAQMPRRVFSRWYSLAVTVALAGFVVFFVLTRPPSNPLRYPLQTVSNRIPGVPVPALVLGEDVSVYAAKCNDSNRTVSVRGVGRWQSVSPRGSTVQSAIGTAERPPGCEYFHYENEPPPMVIARTKRLFAQGFRFVEWQITGEETPVAGGQSRTWSSQVFRIYPKETTK